MLKVGTKRRRWGDARVQEPQMDFKEGGAALDYSITVKTGPGQIS
jgi:hypothetical protein